MTEALIVRGEIAGNSVEVRWEDGELSGDVGAVAVVETIAEMGYEIETPGGLPTVDAGLNDRYSAVHTIISALDEVYSIDGGPELDVELGAVAGAA
jgi:hypothetical protein